MADPLSLGFIGRNGAYPPTRRARSRLVLPSARASTIAPRLVDPGYSWNFRTPSSFTSTSIGRSSDATIRPTWRCIADARTFLRQCWPSWRERRRRNGAAGWHAEIGLDGGLGGNTRAQLRDPCQPIRPERWSRLPGGAAADRHARLRRGVNHNWFMQFWQARRPQTMLNSGVSPAWASARAGVLGAKLAAPERPCVAIAGDGSSPWCRTCC
jgi:acetolactate synthase-1/2/3 large subunit